MKLIFIQTIQQFKSSGYTDYIDSVVAHLFPIGSHRNYPIDLTSHANFRKIPRIYIGAYNSIRLCYRLRAQYSFQNSVYPLDATLGQALVR